MQEVTTKNSRKVLKLTISGHEVTLYFLLKNRIRRLPFGSNRYC